MVEFDRMNYKHLFATLFVLSSASFVLVGCGRKEAGQQVQNGGVDLAPQAVKSIDLKIEKGTDSAESVVGFQKVLAELATDYRDAQILTNAVLLTRLEKTELEDYKKLCDQAIAKWAEVEADSNALDPFLKERGTGYRPFFKHAVSTASGLFAGAFSVDPAYASEEVELEMPRWDKVSLVADRIPGVNRLQVVKNVFNVTSKEAGGLMRDHYSEEAKSWGNWAKGYDIASKTSKTVNTASKVALFVGGAVITAGGSAVLTMPAGAAITTGFGASVGAVDGAIMAINGVDMALEVSETTASLAFGSEKTAAAYAEARETIAPVTTLIGIYSLKSGMQDPGNLYTAYDLSANAVQSAHDYFNVDMKKDKAVITSGSRKDYPFAVNEDGIIKQLPPGNYLVDTNTPLPPKYPSAEELKAMFPTFGVYRGTADFEMLVMNQRMNVQCDVTVTVGKQGDVTYKFSKKGNIPYNMPGANLAMSADYSLDGELKGKMANEDLAASEGSFMNYAKVNMPAEYASYIPPEMAAQLSNSAKGSGNVVGKVDGPGRLSGTISLSANGKTYEGTWEALMK